MHVITLYVTFTDNPFFFFFPVGDVGVYNLYIRRNYLYGIGPVGQICAHA